MNLKVLSRVGALGSIGCAGYVVGVFTERLKKDESKSARFPGLPIFGTVSAATPIVPSRTFETPQDVIPTKSRVGQVRLFPSFSIAFPTLLYFNFVF